MGLVRDLMYRVGACGVVISGAGEYFNSSVKYLGLGMAFTSLILGTIESASRKLEKRSIKNYFNKHPEELKQYIPIAKEALEKQITRSNKKIEAIKFEKDSLQKAIRDNN